jgi:hypothetical protein
MRGGRPGEYPSFEGAYEGGLLPHPVPIKSLWDPFGFTKKMTAEKKAKSLKVTRTPRSNDALCPSLAACTRAVRFALRRGLCKSNIVTASVLNSNGRGQSRPLLACPDW